MIRYEEKGFRYGHSQNPVSKGELVEKFRDCTYYSAKPLPVENSISMVSNLEELEDVSQIIQLVS